MRKLAKYFQFVTIIYITLLPHQLISQTAIKPATGDGSENNPYEIAILENLYWLTQSDTVWDKHFIQIADIDASSSVNWDDGAGFTPIGSLATKFTGSYNGNRHIIKGISIQRPDDDNVGLFGFTNKANIDSLGLVNVNIEGFESVGGLVGYLAEGQVMSCYSKEIRINGRINAGGLIGYSSGIINSSYSCANVSSMYYMAGGFIGINEGVITNSYSMGSISGNNRVGGFVGYNKGTITNVYSTTSVLGTYKVGGFVGENIGLIVSCFWNTETSTQSASDGGTGLTTAEMLNIKTYLKAEWDFMEETLNGAEDIWGLNNSENSGCPFLSWQGFENNVTLECQAPLSPVDEITLRNIWADALELGGFTEAGYGATGYIIYINSEDSWIAPVDGDSPSVNTTWQNTGQQCIYTGSSNNPDVTVTGLINNTEYFLKVYAYNECSDIKKYEKTGADISQYTKVIYTVPDGNGTEDKPYNIANIDNLVWLMYSDSAWNKHYIQTTDIDASISNTWKGGFGFQPIGNSKNAFTGSYNGKGHIIDGITINRPDEDYIGLFGKTTNAVLDSIGLINIDYSGNSYIGGITGYFDNGKITNCYSTGTSDLNNIGGGMVGYNRGQISNSYSSVNVILSGDYGGGFVGYNVGNIMYSYAIGNVSGDRHIGGFVGFNDLIIAGSCFWDTETSTQSTSDGGTGLTTDEMKNFKNYLSAGWDIDNETYNGSGDYWGLNSSENNAYPFLSWQGYTNNVICQAPFSTVSNIVLSDILVNSIKMESITKSGYGMAGYCIYISNEDNWFIPEDGTEPITHSVWQNNGQQCIYFGSSNNPDIKITGLEENTKYYFKVYAYNDCYGIETYEQTGTVISQLTDIAILEPEGEGSNNNPYIIANRENLAWLMRSDTVWDKHFIQTADIDLSTSINWDNGKGFNPIGNIKIKFRGSYDGKGHIIKNLYINRPYDFIHNNYDDRYPILITAGFFGITDNAIIKNLGLSDIEIIGTTNVGGLVGYFLEGEIVNCYTSGTCTVERSGVEDAPIGGLIGYNSGEVTSCFSNVAINSSSNVSGGLVGCNTTFISDCSSDADINSKGEVVGGLVGYNLGIIEQSHALGNIVGNSIVGGLVGNNANLVSYCYSDANVNSTGDIVGGLIGENHDVITCSYSMNNVFGNNIVGGLTGYNIGSITMCYSDAITRSNFNGAGGLVGLNENFISSSYSNGAVTGNDYIGGLVGVNSDVILHCYSRSYVNASADYCSGLIGNNYGVAISSFWDIETSGQETSVGGEGLKTAEMQNVNSYVLAGWDFMDETKNGSGEYWGLNSSVNEGYPFLFWQGYENTADITTEINNPNNNNEIVLYPNPVNEILYVSFNEKMDRLTISDMTGRIIIDKNVNNIIQNVDVASFNAGIYFVNVYKANKIYTSKIIKR